jgi:hypothetical protein
LIAASSSISWRVVHWFFERHISGAVVHVSHSGDAESQKQREMPVVGHRVDVHVPQAGDEIAACTFDQLGIVRYPHLAGRANRYDAVARNENRLFGAERP